MKEREVCANGKFGESLCYFKGLIKDETHKGVVCAIITSGKKWQSTLFSYKKGEFLLILE